MATPIKRIEKEFLLKVIYDEQIPIMYLRDRAEYILTIEKPVKDEICFKSNRPIDGLKHRKKIDLMFDYRGQVISFSVEVDTVKDEHLTAETPEYLYKNLDRSYSRIETPQGLEIQFTFLGDRYSLGYPKILEFDNEGPGELMKNIDPRNLSGLIEQMAAWIRGFASGYKLVIFKDVSPQSTEEHIVAEMGKTLFIPMTLGNLPQSDPYPKKRIITEDMFKRYLESTGVDLKFIDDACDRFLRSKTETGILSDAWTPILFQEYVIGYIHLWINQPGKPPFDYGVLDNLYQFAKILAFSLKANGYFEAGKIKNEPYDGKVVDISASGMLFAAPQSTMTQSLLPDSEISLRLVTPRRTVKTNARIVRRYKDSSQGYFGCRYLDMEPEDMRFLFEFIYGKPFTDTDAVFLSGQV
jgi:hypothetical protein